MKRTVRFFLRRLILLVFNIFAGPAEFRLLQDCRRYLISLLGTRIGPNSQFSEGLYIYDGQKFRMGSGCRLGAFAKIWDYTGIVIGNNLLASHNLVLISATHDVNDLSNLPGPITIGSNVWIGANVTIVGPVTIGDNVIIGGCSFVTRDIPSNSIFGGVPARFIRERNPQNHKI